MHCRAPTSMQVSLGPTVVRTARGCFHFHWFSSGRPSLLLAALEYAHAWGAHREGSRMHTHGACGRNVAACAGPLLLAGRLRPPAART